MGFVNPKTVAPSLSLATLDVTNKSNYLIVYDEILSPTTPFHYYPLRADVNEEVNSVRITNYPHVIAPGLVLVKGRRLYQVGVTDLQRGKLTSDMQIQDVNAYVDMVNGVDAAASSVSEEEGVQNGSESTARNIVRTTTDESDLSSEEIGAIKATFAAKGRECPGHVGETEGVAQATPNAIIDLPDVEQEELLSNTLHPEGFRSFR